MGILQSIFSKKNSKLPYDLSDLVVDVHSHLIPGIDDGAQTMDQTIGMLLKFHDLGIRRIITTPHIMSDMYNNTPEIILKGLDDVKAVIEKLKIDIEIEAAAEYFFDEFLIEKVKKKELLTFGESHVLFEFSFSTEPLQIADLIFRMKTNGYQPILAHFERYPYYFNQPEKHVEDFKMKGVKLQMNLNSLTGHYGPQVRKQAELMIDKGWVDMVGSDCHRIDHLAILENNLTLNYFHKLKEIPLINRGL
jgi:tyrosine-protein phosphatase YwqE